MVRAGFFNSLNGDRVYNADDLSSFFDGIIDDGVFKHYKMEFMVTPGAGLSVDVLEGKAIVLGKYIEATAQVNMPIEGGEAQPRYDAVVVGTNLTERTATIYIKKGIPAASPSRPQLLNNELEKELCLAYIYVGANANAITESNIEDVRGDYAHCGWCHLTNVSADLVEYRRSVPVTAATTDIEIRIPQYDAAYDTLIVHKNGLLLKEGIEYSIQSTGSAAAIVIEQGVLPGNDFDFLVLHLDLKRNN